MCKSNKILIFYIEDILQFKDLYNTACYKAAHKNVI